jgi:ferredoxin
MRTPPERPGMRIEFDRDTCIGMFQCVAEWDGFEKDEEAGKAVLVDGEAVDDDVFAREVPEDAEFDAKFAARACPVDAIKVYDDSGDQVIP